MLTTIKGETESGTTVVGEFNMPLTKMYRSLRQKIKKETQILNDALDLVDNYRAFHP